MGSGGQPTPSSSTPSDAGRQPVTPSTLAFRSTSHPVTSAGPRLQSSSMDDYSPRLTSPTVAKASLPIASPSNSRFIDRKNSGDIPTTILDLNYKRLHELPADVDKRVELEKYADPLLLAARMNPFLGYILYQASSPFGPCLDLQYFKL